MSTQRQQNGGAANNQSLGKKSNGQRHPPQQHTTFPAFSVPGFVPPNCGCGASYASVVTGSPTSTEHQHQHQQHATESQQPAVVSRDDSKTQANTATAAAAASSDAATAGAAARRPSSSGTGSHDPTRALRGMHSPKPKTRHMRMFGNPVQSYDLQESNRLYRRLFENNRSFAADKVAADPDFFKRMSESQSPHYMLVGCSDSRVPPDQLTKTQPGEIFIHRNVANVVVHTDMNFTSVLQYAVEVLRVKHVIVMGHYGCGGVKAAMTNTPHGLIDKWLRNIKDVMRLHRSELNAIKDENERFQRLVELNVQESVFNIYKTSILQQAWAEGDRVQVHGWVYNINTGLIKDLHVERSSSWQEIEEIYELNYADTISGQEAQSMHPLRMFRSSFDLTAEIEADKAPKSN